MENQDIRNMTADTMQDDGGSRAGDDDEERKAA